MIPRMIRLVNSSSSQAYFFVGQGIYYGYSDNYEQVSHFLNGDRIGPVPQDTENGKQTEGKTQLKLHTFKQDTKQKDNGADQHKGEQVVFSSCQWGNTGRGQSPPR